MWYLYMLYHFECVFKYSSLYKCIGCCINKKFSNISSSIYFLIECKLFQYLVVGKQKSKHVGFCYYAVAVPPSHHLQTISNKKIHISVKKLTFSFTIYFLNATYSTNNFKLYLPYLFMKSKTQYSSNSCRKQSLVFRQNSFILTLVYFAFNNISGKNLILTQVVFVAKTKVWKRQIIVIY